MTKQNIQIAVPAMAEEEWEALREPIMSGWLTQGGKVSTFERNFADLHGAQHAMAVTSATTGLHLALAGLDIGPGDEVIVPAFTWVSTANVVLYRGATPVFVDVDPVTYNMNVDAALAEVTDRTRAVLPVHLFGLCADVTALRNNLPGHIHIVEDAACAAGAKLGNQFAGTLGTCGVFSFHPRKSITTGEGGMVTTMDSALADRLTILRNHGASVSEEARHHGPQPHILPDFDELGFNYRMTDLQAAVGVVQLKKLEGFISERSRQAARYRELLADIDWLRLPDEPENGRHAWQAFVTYVDPAKAPMPRNEIMRVLNERGIATRPGTHAVHMLGYYQRHFGLRDSDFPAAEAANNNTMAIPLHNRLTDTDLERISDALHDLAG